MDFQPFHRILGVGKVFDLYVLVEINVDNWIKGTSSAVLLSNRPAGSIRCALCSKLAGLIPHDITTLTGIVLITGVCK